MKLAAHVHDAEFAQALPDLLHAAVGVELSTFIDRIRGWQWHTQPDATDDNIDTAFDNRSLTLQPGLFGGIKGTFQLDAAGAVIIEDALYTRPDPTTTLDGPRTLAQRNADRLVELAALANMLDDAVRYRSLTELLADAPNSRHTEPSGARQLTLPNVDVVIDLPTLISGSFDLDDHRDDNGDVDWDSIHSSFATTGIVPKQILQQFFCDASWRTLITAGGSVILDYTEAKPELTRAQRRAVQRRDKHCQFDGCDRAVRFAHFWSCSLTLSTPNRARPQRRLGPTPQPHPALPQTPHHDPPTGLATLARHRRTNTNHRPLSSHTRDSGAVRSPPQPKHGFTDPKQDCFGSPPRPSSVNGSTCEEHEPRAARSLGGAEMAPRRSISSGSRS